MSDNRTGQIAARLELWFESSHRKLPWRVTYDPWQVWVSETMLQQTRMAVVLPYFERFVARFPTVAALAEADEEEVLAAWSGLGYYRRARLLHAAAREVLEKHGGAVPSDPVALRGLPGVGPYTAGAIASIAFGCAIEAVDGNVERVVARLEAVEAPVGTAVFARGVRDTAREIVTAAGSPRSLNQAIMELGALVCTPRSPSCGECPVSFACIAFQRGEPEEWPRRAPRESRRSIVVPLFLVRDDAGRVLLVRGSGRLLGGMYHLPHGSPQLDPGLDLSRAVARGPRIASFRHAITNRSIEFEIYEAETRGGDGALGDVGEAMWIHPGELAGIPHPSYVRKALGLLSS